MQSRQCPVVVIADPEIVFQAYYALYHGAQALMVALGQPRPTTHPKTQQFFANFWTDRNLLPPPWTLRADSTGYGNFPPEVVIDEGFHPWARCDKNTRWQIAAKALRTTREEAIEDALRDGRDTKSRKRMRA
jgi:hypothetical protein